MKNSNIKTIYFADENLSCGFQTAKQEYDEFIGWELKKHDIEFTNIKYTHKYPFNDNYDVLFFDYGGMSIGNSMINSLCRVICKDADDNPSRIFVMTSTFTRMAMQDAISEFGNKLNIFLHLQDFISYFKNKQL